MTPFFTALPQATRARKLLLVMLLVLSAASVKAQATTAAFDVATIRPSPPIDTSAIAASIRAGKMPRFGALVDGSRADYRYMTLRELVASAYKIEAFQVSGPDWMGEQRFDIAATLPAGTTKEDAPAMLQQLLAERFKLAVHTTTQERPVLALVVGKSGPRLKEGPPTEPIDENTPLQPGEMKADGPDGPMRIKVNGDGSATVNMGVKGVMTQKMDAATQSMKLQASSISMDGFATMLTKLMSAGGTGGKQVVDMTGLKGNYCVSVELSLAELMATARNAGVNMPRPSPAGDSTAIAAASDPVGGSTIYASVQALGLKLEPRNAQLMKLVVDHAEKTPTEN